MRKVLLVSIAMMACSSSIFSSSTWAADAAAVAKQPVVTDRLPRLSYVAFRVLDLDRSLKFYKDVLGMTERTRIPLANGVLEVLLGYGDPNNDAGILLLHNPKRTEPYTHADGYHRYILTVKDMSGLIAHLKANGAKVTIEPTLVEKLNLSYAFVSDPDGYVIELVENH